jgi:uncharacterized protein YutE (UPF0331/DUF86 family)
MAAPRQEWPRAEMEKSDALEPKTAQELENSRKFRNLSVYVYNIFEFCKWLI